MWDVTVYGFANEWIGSVNERIFEDENPSDSQHFLRQRKIFLGYHNNNCNEYTRIPGQLFTILAIQLFTLRLMASVR